MLKLLSQNIERLCLGFRIKIEKHRARLPLVDHHVELFLIYARFERVEGTFVDLSIDLAFSSVVPFLSDVFNYVDLRLSVIRLSPFEELVRGHGDFPFFGFFLWPFVAEARVRHCGDQQFLVQGLLRSIYSTSQTKTAINISETLFVLLGNIISNLVCSKSLFDTKKKEGRELKDMFFEILQIIVLPNISDLIPFLRPFDLQGLRRSMKMEPTFDKFFDKLVDDRLEERKNCVEINKNRRSDFLDVLLDYRSDKEEDVLKQLFKFDMKGLLADMFVADTDTTPSTIQWGITEILKNMEVYKKVLAELDDRHPTLSLKKILNRFVEEIDIHKLVYFQAVIKEVFRLHPGVPLLIPRVLMNRARFTVTMKTFLHRDASGTPYGAVYGSVNASLLNGTFLQTR
ncbi:hypothetical protein GIB67_030918 [Kingdonia uniflora]|uniref:Cytochrome P450 n=1 Tax=Kingdonia uniflora TaxID=39325 RepID=A0A7J7L3N0_9MAGN|nr:hypothetical protein GIB67_030918 [Kingdonia uniflora]